MNLFEKVLYFLQGEMIRPKSYGWFHLLCLFISFLLVFILYKLKNRYSEKQLKIVLAIYGIITFLLELTKQLIWSFNFDAVTNITNWDYQWYAAPFQLCTTPMFVCLIMLFMKKNKLRDSLTSYLCFYTILGSIVTMIMPDSCFTKYIEVNIHTMFLHCGSFVVSMFLIMNNEIKLNYKNFLSGFKVLLVFIALALSLDLIMYNTGIIGDETFNMFFISPYFISTLPIYDIVQKSAPYLVYLLFYIVTLFIGGNITYFVVKGYQKLIYKFKTK